MFKEFHVKGRPGRSVYKGFQNWGIFQVGKIEGYAKSILYSKVAEDAKSTDVFFIHHPHHYNNTLMVFRCVGFFLIFNHKIHLFKYYLKWKACVQSVYVKQNCFGWRESKGHGLPQFQPLPLSGLHRTYTENHALYRFPPQPKTTTFLWEPKWCKVKKQLPFISMEKFWAFPGPKNNRPNQMK